MAALRNSRRLLLIAAAAALTVAGCSSGGSSPTRGGTASAPSSTAASPNGTAVPTGSAAMTPKALLARVALVNGDLAKGFTVKLLPGGDSVKGQPTLDNCAYAFTTEAHRVARRQVVVLDPHGAASGVSNEVVVYDSPAAAAKAIAEWRLSVTRCQKGVFVKSRIVGVPAMRFDQAEVTTEPNLPISDNAVTAEKVTPKGSSVSLYGFGVLQERGTVLTAMWLQSGSVVPPQALDGLLALAAASGRRLAST